MEQKRLKTSRYITGFDGMRTLAVIGVILYHLLPSKMRGGYLGVPVFFAMSGYLITDLLLQEWRQNGKIALGKFWARRLKRLYPGMVVLMITATAYITLFQRNLLNNLRGMFASTLLYWNNWWQINHGLSYFDRFGNESPFTHLWYLSVEFQNYLLWPLLFILLMKFGKKRSRAFIFVSAVAIASAVWMAVLFKPGGDPTRVYYGTDTRLFSIWLGSALAFIWPSTRLKKEIPPQAKRILNITGLSALGLLLLGFFFLSDQLSFLYYGGMFLVSVVSVILIAVVAHPGASLNKWLTNPLFSYIGKRSYGIYLYQYPVMIFYEAKIKNVGENVWLHTAIELVLILICSELSYRFVEIPLKNFDYKQTGRTIKGWFSKPLFSWKKPFLFPTIALLIVTVVGLAIAPTNQVNANQLRMQKQAAANRKIAEESQKAAKEKAQETQTTDTTSTEPLNETQQALITKFGENEAALRKVADLKVTAVGDSVMLGAAEYIKAVFPKVVFDADIGRQVYNTAPILEQLKKDNLLYDTVVIGLGTNGLFNTSQFDELMQIIGTKRKVYWVNMRAPSVRSQGTINDMLNQMAEKYSNLQIIDWYSYSNEQPAWFYEDNIHTNPDGSMAYTKMLVDTLSK